MNIIVVLNFWEIGNEPNNDLLISATKAIKEYNNNAMKGGYCSFFTKKFKISFEVLIRRPHISFSSLVKLKEEKTEIFINDYKTFKVEQCVFCLDNIPKVFFL